MYRRIALIAGSCVLVALFLAGGAVSYRYMGYWVNRLRGNTCIGCHAKLHPVMVAEWKRSKHFLAGVGCEACHGTDHAKIQGQDGKVSAKMCGESCHPREFAQFALSKHSHPITGLKADLLLRYPSEVGGCTFTIGCHAIRQPYPDGSSGKCSSCHPSHEFSLTVARDPGTCITCHSGSFNTEGVEYEKSIHGVLYRKAGLKGGGANCVTCHMPGGNHNDGTNVTRVVAEPGKPPLHFVKTMSREEFDLKRAAMLDVCKQCHGVKLARRVLDEGDAFREKGAYMLEEAGAIVQALYDEGLLDPMPQDRTPNPFAGPVLFLGANQLFDSDMSAAERIFYRMYMFTYAGAWHKAYHNLPALIRWQENEMLKNDLIMLRAESRRLHALARAGGIKPHPPRPVAQAPSAPASGTPPQGIAQTNASAPSATK